MVDCIQRWCGESRPGSYGLERLVETRFRLRKLKEGQSTTLTIASIGDSYTHNSSRWCQKTATALWRKYGAGEIAPLGRGWIGFGAADFVGGQNGSITGNDQVTFGGVWKQVYAAANGPDLCSIVSTDTGAQARISLDYSRRLSWSLFARGGAGVVRYRWSEPGEWETIDLSSMHKGTQVVPLSGAPETGGDVLTIETVIGPVELYGLNEGKAGNGIRWHKLGTTGGRLSQVASANELDWKAGISALEPDLVIIMFGANDQGAGKARFKADMLTVIDRIRAVGPSADILMVSQPENMRDNKIPMSRYAQAMYEIVRDSRFAAWGDLQPHFGEKPKDYASGSRRSLFSKDGIHPDVTTGGYVMQDAILRWIGELSA